MKALFNGGCGVKGLNNFYTTQCFVEESNQLREGLLGLFSLGL